MVYLKMERNEYFYSLLHLSFLVLISKGCLSYTEYCEIGNEVCLEFLKINSFSIYAIRIRSSLICISFYEQSTYIFPNNFGNKSTFNCTVSATLLSVCIGNFQSEDAGTFSLHYGSTSDSVILKSITLAEAISVYNISLIPSDNPLTVREGIHKVIQCVVNSDADPTPTITWYMGSTDITSRAGKNTTFITLTGNRTDNGKNLECRATNDKKSPKIGNTTLNVEYSPIVNTLFQQDIIEGRDLFVTCTATPGNPSSTTFYWTKVDNPGFRQNGSTLQLSNIHRTSSGTYRCKAENYYSNGERGTHNQSMIINVQYPPIVNTLFNQNIIEGNHLSFTCQATPGNPSLITFYWTKLDNPGFRQNGSTLQLYTIHRNNTGTYRCTAENNYYNGERGTHNQTMVVSVLYPPTVNTLSRQKIIEGSNLSITCQVNLGNPSFTAMYWTKVDDAGFRRNGATLHLLDIQRTSSGIYRCTAENNYGNGEKGTNSQLMSINVLYTPTIESRPLQIVNESEKVTITRIISSNPLSNVSWYSKTELLKTQTSVATTAFIIERATCIDTKNFTLVVSNGVGNTVTAVVELIVNCKPIPDKTLITVEVTFTTGIEFSTTIIAYPEPFYELEYKNGTRNNQMVNNITRNAVNNFTVYFKQAVIDQSSFGLYYLRTSNIFGESTVPVIVIEQRKGRPDIPMNLSVVCERTQARVHWVSSFNGGDPQLFTVIILNGQDGTNLSYRFEDNGENELHVAHVSNLQPSVTYWFFVSAKNSYGSSSSEVIRCKTLQEIASSKTGIVAGSVGGALVLVMTVLILGIVVHRRYTCICNIAFEKKERNTTVETNKEASNYTTIQEQEYTARNMYDDLTLSENANQYEDILKKDNHGYDEKLYEKLQKCVDKDNEAISTKQRIPLKNKDSKNDKFEIQNTEVYVNTTFMK